MIYVYFVTGGIALLCLLVDLYCRGYTAGRDSATAEYTGLLERADHGADQIARAFEILNRREWKIVEVGSHWLLTYPVVMPAEMPPFMSDANPFDPVLLAEAWLVRHEKACAEVTKT